MQSELKLVKEFRRKRAQMQRELDEVTIFYLNDLVAVQQEGGGYPVLYSEFSLFKKRMGIWISDSLFGTKP